MLLYIDISIIKKSLLRYFLLLYEVIRNVERDIAFQFIWYVDFL